MSKSSSHPAWRMLIAGCLLVGGGQGVLMNCLGIYLVPICEANGFSQGTYTLALSAGALTSMVFMMMAGKILQKFPFKPLLLVSTFITVAAYICMGQIHQLWMFFIALPVLMGVGAIPVYVAGPTLISNWFVEKKGLAMGIMMASGSVFGVIFSMVGGSIIAGKGYSTALLVMGAACLVMMVIGALLAVVHPASMGMRAFGAAEEQTHTADNSAGAVGIPASVAIKSAAFVCSFIVVFLIINCCSFSNMITALGLAYGYEIGRASSFLSLFMIGSFCGNFIIGFLNDKIGLKNTLILVLLLIACSMAVIALLGSNPALYTVGIICFGVCASSGGVMPPLLAGKLFGQKDYASVFGKLQMATSAGGLTAMPIYGFIFDASNSYTPSLILFASLAVLCIPLVIAAFKSGQKLWQKTLGVAMQK